MTNLKIPVAVHCRQDGADLVLGAMSIIRSASLRTTYKTCERVLIFFSRHLADYFNLRQVELVRLEGVIQLASWPARLDLSGPRGGFRCTAINAKLVRLVLNLRGLFSGRDQHENLKSWAGS